MLFRKEVALCADTEVCDVAFTATAGKVIGF
jgi:hypothetical protein